METIVEQRSEEWYTLRSKCLLTSSRFGDAIGVGTGKPFDFLTACVQNSDPDEENAHLKHGILMEKPISEAYQLLTQNKIRDSGFWTPKDNSWNGLIGASPDLIVVDKCTDKSQGLVEIKAPIYKMYNKTGDNVIKGIPRAYMAQIQGQMAVCGLTWCDFIAVCSSTKEIIMKRVQFHPIYWRHISSKIREFCVGLKEACLRKEKSMPPFEFSYARQLKATPRQERLFPGESAIVVGDLLQMKDGKYRCKSGLWVNCDFLLGESYKIPSDLNQYSKKLIDMVDADIKIATH